jgi:hypothetical protein
VENNYRKILLTRDDLKRISTRIVKEKVARSRKHPEGRKEVQVYFVDNHQIKGGIKQAELELKKKIWREKQKEEFTNNHGWMFK